MLGAPLVLCPLCGSPQDKVFPQGQRPPENASGPWISQDTWAASGEGEFCRRLLPTMGDGGVAGMTRCGPVQGMLPSFPNSRALVEFSGQVLPP